MISGTKSRLWLRWVGANALAELIGLGATFTLDILILARVAAATSALASLAGMRESIIEGLSTPSEECADEVEW